MKTNLLSIALGCAGLVLTGCSTPRGGTAENNFNEPSTYTTNTVNAANEGTTPLPMAKPQRSGMNPEDLRDPQSLAWPHPTPAGP